MTPEQITALIQLGSAGAVIIAVVYFLQYISKRDDKDKQRDLQWQAFFRALLETKDAPILRVAEIVEAFYKDFQEHNTWERTQIGAMEKRLLAKNEPRTKPRQAPQPPADQKEG